MTEGIGGYPPTSEGGGTQQSTVDVAREEAANVGETARDAGASVAGTTAEQARNVAAETRRQATSLLEDAGSQVREQARAQQRRAAQNLHTLAGQLNDMADGSTDSGMAGQLAGEVSNRVHGVASWLEQREPGELLDEVRDFARRRPGTFLLGAALAGVLAGRMTRGVTAAAHQGQTGGSPQSTGVPATPAPAIAEPAGTWPDPADGTVPVVPSPGTGPATEYGSDLPGAEPAGRGRGTDAGYPYRPGQP